MGKKLLTLLAGFMALTASAETVVKVDLSQITQDNATAVTDGVTVTSGRKSSTKTYFDGKQLRFYAKDVLTISSEYDILAVNFTSTTTSNPISNLTCSTDDYSYTTDPAAVTASTKDVTYNLITPVKSIVFSNTAQTRFNTLSVTIAAEPDTRNEVTLSWPEKQYDAVLENGFTAPTLSVDPEVAKGEVVYSSSDESVATVDANGAVTLVGTGLTTIKAAISDSETYKNASAEYALIVTTNKRENPFTVEFKKGTSKDGIGDLTTTTDLFNVILVGAQYIDSVTKTSGTVKYQSTDGIRIGASSSAGSVTFKLDQSYVISKIVLGFAPYNTKDNGAVTVNSVTQNFSSSDMPAELVYEYTGTDKKSVEEIVITTGGSTKRALISSITVYYEEGNQASAELAFANNEYTAFLGATFTSPKATTVSNGQITYASSNTDVATVDEQTGDVTVLAVGTTVITASVAETEEFYSGEAEYTLTVVDPAAQLPYYVSALGVDFTFEQAESYPWSYDKTYGLKGSGFVSGAVVACDGLAISPVIDLSVCVDPVLDFQQAFNNYKIDNVMIDVADLNGYAFVMVKEEGDADWSELAVPTAPAAFSWTFYPNEQIDLGAYAGKKIQIAFKYVSTEECAGTWEVKNITVAAITDLAILVNGERPTDQSFDENTEITLTAPAGAVIYYAWVANDPSVMADANAVDSYDWIEAPSNPYTMTVGNHKGELLKVRSTASDDKIAQLLFPEDGVVTRIENVVAGVTEASAEWFDLQGRRVAEPANGLYIRRQGRTATKVLVK
ncbi:MAG: Ig-like domain-containing protein [Muribaculaceae bacterium]|nr:Ig-like domain-containing protein [Muribaculaceae bacterium]MDE6120025.1 Ig-like domain-containing protein [Muribaculaceae bacterium]